MIEAGYTEAERLATSGTRWATIEKVRQEVKLYSGDYVDLKMYEPAMRHLLDTYIRADESRVLSTFDDMTLVDLLIERAEDAVNSIPEGIRGEPPRRRRDDREQRPPSDRGRDGRKPEVLRADVEHCSTS